MQIGNRQRRTVQSENPKVLVQFLTESFVGVMAYDVACSMHRTPGVVSILQKGCMCICFLSPMHTNIHKSTEWARCKGKEKSV